MSRPRSGDDIAAEIHDELYDDKSARAYTGTCCGYPSRQSCIKGTLSSPKFWAAICASIVVFVMLLVIDAKMNNALYISKALVYWNMAEVERIENLTHDCICGQWICPVKNDTVISKGPLPPDRASSHGKRDTETIRDDCADTYAHLETMSRRYGVPNEQCVAELRKVCGVRLTTTLCELLVRQGNRP